MGPLTRGMMKISTPLTPNLFTSMNKLQYNEDIVYV